MLPSLLLIANGQFVQYLIPLALDLVHQTVEFRQVRASGPIMHHCAGLVTRFAEYLKPRLLKISEFQANRMPTLWSLIIRVSVCQNPMNIHCNHC